MSKVTKEQVIAAKAKLAELRANKDSKQEDILAAKNEVNRLKGELSKDAEKKA